MMTKMNSQDYVDLEERIGAHNYHPLDVVLTRGEGVWVFDVEGNRYLDCLSSYSALNQGHVHPRILNALIEQARKLTLTSRAFRSDQLALFYKELTDLTGYDMVLPMNSGAEGVETSLKVARKWAYAVKKIPRDKAEIIVAEGNFHGRTISIISFSSEPTYKDDFGPHTPGFITIPFGDSKALENAITPNTAAVLLEPIQGESGVNIPPEGYLQAVRKICDQNNVLFMADEIQTGLGRTGKLMAVDHDGVRPDVLILGKALGGGFYPVSAVLADSPIMGVIHKGDHGSTFGGNPLGAAVARESLKVLVEEGLIENAAEQGEYFMEQLCEINSPKIKEIRGRGLLIGVELHNTAGGARKYCEALQKEGILAKETHVNIIRFAPPLVIDRETIDWAMGKIRKVILEVT
jgi:ornithine--oxo-acid transaminase